MYFWECVSVLGNVGGCMGDWRTVGDLRECRNCGELSSQSNPSALPGTSQPALIVPHHPCCCTVLYRTIPYCTTPYHSVLYTMPYHNYHTPPYQICISHFTLVFHSPPCTISCVSCHSSSVRSPHYSQSRRGPKCNPENKPL